MSNRADQNVPLCGRDGEQQNKDSDLLPLSTRTNPQEAVFLSPRGPKRLIFRSGTGLLFVDPLELSRIDAERDYVRLYIGNETRLIRMTMGTIERQLSGMAFVRVHRSMIVNLAYVREMRAASSGDYQLVMSDARAVKLSRKYRDNLKKFLTSDIAV